jgi:hypothetical protein
MATIMCSLHRWYGESTTPCISESKSRRLRVSVIRGVDNSAYQWYGESPTLRVGDSGSRCLNTFWKTPRITDTRSRRLPASVIRGVADSPYQWYAESLTPRIVDTGSRLLNFLKERESTPRISVTVSRRLPVSLSRVIDDSVYHWYGELTTPRIVESRSRHSLYWWVTIW